MIHLSRLVLDPRGREVRRDLADCQNLHRTVMAAFPETTDGRERARERFGVLYRLEPSPRGGGPPVVLVQSDVRPEWSRLAPGYLLDSAGEGINPACRSVDDRYRAIATGAVLRFRLRANPTKKVGTSLITDSARSNGRRVPLLGETDRLTWLARKGEEGGYSILGVRERTDVPDTRLSGVEPVQGFRREPTDSGQSARQRITFAGVLFDGKLVVTNPSVFYETLRRGIGPAKAYGFGLLSVAPAQE